MKESHEIENLRKFIDSKYEDISYFNKACDKNINLEIYLCLSKNHVKEIIEKYKEQHISSPKELLDKLISNQPYMNSTLEIFEKCAIKIQSSIDNYIKFNGFKMANSAGNAEDWYEEFLLKYWYTVNFYKTRWFFPEKLKKKSKVEYNLMLYKDFLYQAKAIISNEKRLKAHIAAKKQDDSLKKSSLDKLYSNNNKKSIMENITNDEDGNKDINKVETDTTIKRVLDRAKNYTNDEEIIKKITDILYNKKNICADTAGRIIEVSVYKEGYFNEKIINDLLKLPPKTKNMYGLNVTKLNIDKESLKTNHNLNSEYLNYSYYNGICNNLSPEEKEEYKKWNKKVSTKHRRKKSDEQ